MDTREKIVRSAGSRGKTKREIADALGLSYSHTAKVVNDLTFAGELALDTSKTERKGIDVFIKASSSTSTASSTSSRSTSSSK